jgi:hypothetical protein
VRSLSRPEAAAAAMARAISEASIKGSARFPNALSDSLVPA